MQKNDQNDNIEDQFENEGSASAEDQLRNLSDKLAKELTNICEILSADDNFQSDYTEIRLSFLKRVINSLSSDMPSVYMKLGGESIQHLGEIEWRCLRACRRLADALNEEVNDVDLSDRFKKEFEIIESLSSEILTFINLYNANEDERSQLSALLREAKLAKEMYTQLIERLDDVRGHAVEIIGKAKEEAINDSSTIKELVSKSTNAYLAADFADRKKSNAIELIFWFVLMSSLLAVDAWLIWSFDIVAKDVWQNRLIDLGLIGFVATVAFWVGKNFRAAMHQRSVLDQRIATLKTFQAFYDKVENPELKDAIVIEASKTIFSHTSSGYAADSTASDLPSVSDLARIVSATK